MNKVSVEWIPVDKGVFSKTHIKKGELIGAVKGKIVSDTNRNDLSIDYDDTHVLIPFMPFKELNHSCDPNCYLQNRKGKIQVVANRKINPREELKLDYGWNCGRKIKCLCGSKKCRGYINHD